MRVAAAAVLVLLLLCASGTGAAGARAAAAQSDARAPASRRRPAATRSRAHAALRRARSCRSRCTVSMPQQLTSCAKVVPSLTRTVTGWGRACGTGVCPSSNGVCCVNSCCPAGYLCSEDGQSCKGNVQNPVPAGAPRFSEVKSVPVVPLRHMSHVRGDRVSSE